MRLRMKRGDAPVFAMQVTTTDPITGLKFPVDLSDAGIDLAFTAKRRLDDPDGDKVVQKTRAAGGIVVTDAAQGRIEVRLAGADTTALAGWTTLYWDIQLTQGGLSTTLDDGLLYVEPDVNQT